MFDGEAFGQHMVEIVKTYLDAEIAPLKAENARLTERVAELEARKLPEAIQGEPGKDGVVDIDAVKELVQAAVAALPAPEPGKDGKDAVVDMDQVKALIDAAVAALPPAEPGTRGDPGKDGCGVKDLLIDRDGALVATMEDGRTKNLGRIVGKDGRDGDPGKDGRDGFSLEHFDTKWDGARTLTLSFNDGQSEYSHELRLPIMLDRGVYTDGKSYETGDCVTWGGSIWVAQRDTGSKPDCPESGWRLAVKRGRDGKDKA